MELLPMDLLIQTSTREDGSMTDPENRRMFLRKIGLGSKKLVIPQQVHGNSVAYINGSGEDRVIEGVDALYTDDASVALGVLHADCYPVPLWTYRNEKIESFGIAHAGFKGIAYGKNFGNKPSHWSVHGITVALFNAISTLQLNKWEPNREKVLNHEELRAKLKSEVYPFIHSHIGLGICQSHYEIKDDANGLGRFSKHSVYGDKKFGFLYVSHLDGKVHLNLRAIIIDQLRGQGMLKENIHDEPVCNRCSSNKFYSFRRGDKEERNMTIIGIRF